MSLASWKAEFYPIPAEKVSKQDAAAHSLRKWLGLRGAALQKHGVVLGSKIEIPSRFDIVADERGNEFCVDGASCALCVWFLEIDAISGSAACGKCPLSKVRGGISCDSRRDDEESSPYFHFCDDGDPEPMIRWLRKAVALQKKAKK